MASSSSSSVGSGWPAMRCLNVRPSGHQRDQAAAMPAGGAAGGKALFETVEPAVQFHVNR
jgi:hypothetical protein